MSKGRDADIEGELLRDVCERPDDDAPRLAYADWLEARSTHRPGDPDYDRARFIRAQCEWERLPEDPRRAPLEKLANRLLSEHRQEWEIPLRKLGATSIMFYRGFPAEITISGNTFLNDQEGQFFRLAPITGVRMISGFTLEEIKVLATSPHLDKLTSLTLSHTYLGPAGAETLANSPRLSNLTRLCLTKNGIGPAGAAALASSPYLDNLTTLCLDDNGIGPTGAAALANSPHLGNLTTLGLNDNGIGPAGAEALANSPHLSRVTWLYVTGNNIGNHWLQEINRRLATRRLDGHGAEAGKSP